MPIQPYLFFDGRCDEALAFYQKALGAKVESIGVSWTVIVAAQAPS
jgi:uncharacterized glyoxalase superfamily protein PhnB